MLRALWYVPAVTVWNLITLPLIIGSGVLTLGRMGERLINVWSPIWGRVMLAIFGIRLRVVGKEKLQGCAPCVIIMNHESFIDLPALCMLNPPRYTALAKREFLWIPLLGWAMWAVGVIFLDRGNHRRSIASMQRVARGLRERPRSVVVFPEGTRSRTGELQKFKLGAFHLAVDAGVPIVPVVIHGAYACQPPDRMLVVPGSVTIEVKDAIDTAGWAPSEIHDRAEQVRAHYLEWIAAGPPLRD